MSKLSRMETTSAGEFERVLRMATRHAICTEIIPRSKWDSLLIGFGPIVIPKLATLGRSEVKDQSTIMRTEDDDHKVVVTAVSPYRLWTINSDWWLTERGLTVAENSVSALSMTAISQALIGKSIQSWELIDTMRGIDIEMSGDVRLSIRAVRGLPTDRFTFWAIEAGQHLIWMSRSDGELRKICGLEPSLNGVFGSPSTHGTQEGDSRGNG